MTGLGTLLRHQPYRLFFPLGALLGGVGVGHWVPWALGQRESYFGQGHALLQVQAFLTAFACGFLLTMLPRRTQTSPPRLALVLALAVGLVVTAVALLAEAWLPAQGAASLVLILLVAFAGPRLARGGRRPPDAFVAIPIGLGAGLVGSVLVAAASLGHVGRTGAGTGRVLVQEVLFLCLVLGVGAMVAPLLAGRPTPPDAGGAGSVARRCAWAAAALLIVASAPLQEMASATVSPHLGWRLGYGLRGAVFVVAAILGLSLHRSSQRAGTARTLFRISSWLIPAGLLLVAAWPARRIALLHVTFVGGFGLMVFALAAHVTLGHGGFPELRDGRVWSLRVAGALFLLAASTRATADFLPESYVTHVGGAAGIWIAGLLAWLACVAPKLLRPPPT